MAAGSRAGRPRKPTALHVLNGNPSKIVNLDQRAAAEPKPLEIAPDAVPEPPEYMPDSAKECWRENAPMLAATHLLTVADLKALEAYCMPALFVYHFLAGLVCSFLMITNKKREFSLVAQRPS